MIDHKRNGLIKNLLFLSMTLDLKRMPTEAEVLEAYMVLSKDLAKMSDEERALHEMAARAEAFTSLHPTYAKVYEVSDPRFQWPFLDDTDEEIEQRRQDEKYE